MSSTMQHSNQVIPIIILNWNGIKDTKECLDSVFKMEGVQFHVYLIDNGSEPAQVKQLQELYDDNEKLTLILNDKNLGFTLGNNKMVESLMADNSLDFEYIALLNNDTKVEPDWLYELLACAERNNADIVSSKMINFFDRSIMDNSGHKMINTAEIVPVGHAEDISLHTKDQSNFGACAGAALYSRIMIEDIGFFDEHFTTGYEDAEIGARAVLCGYRSFFGSQAIVYHKISQSVTKIFDYNYLLHIQKNIFYSYFKLMPWPVILISIPSFILKYLAVIIIDIVFWRPMYLKIMFQTWYEFFTQEWKGVRQVRKAFFSKHKTISSWKVLKLQEFFLWFDTKRFFKYVLMRKQSEFDKVHG